ncbi:AEC family transporter [Azoarcus olearius]|uniref:Malonate transporter n=1 Tax=Azoarcus sp. (strain BH72) TaxID=418699 RepID=A1K8J6_AZOSB|nr:AEC family transporter [Azoarcus olearius]CAL95151.1 putative malonate transporter [Azoarcus olearius]
MLDILAITGPIFIVIAIGFAAVRSGLFAKADTRALGAFVINIALPAVLFKALSQRSFGEVMNPTHLAAYAIGSLAAFGVGVMVMRVLRRQPMPKAAIVGMGMAMSNSAFIGFPVALQLFGQAAAVGLALALIVENLILLPLVIALAESSGDNGAKLGRVVAQTFARLLKNPIVLAILAGFGASLLGLRPPLMLAKAIDMLALASAPVALFVIGGALVGQKVGGMMADLGLIAAGKLVLHPLAVLTMFWLLPPVDPVLQMAGVLFASAPMATVYPIIGQKYGQDGMCSAALVVTTVASFVTLSVVVGVLRASAPIAAG